MLCTAVALKLCCHVLNVMTGEASRKRDRQSLCNEEMSFQDLVCDISGEQRQKDVTLPFYFICLLHLANEKVSSHLFLCGYN